MQPDFELMTNQELVKYALAHRDEVEPLRVLYRRRSPDSEAVWFAPPQTIEEEQQQFELFRQMLNDRSNGKQSE
jgi:hypothetical protein